MSTQQRKLDDEEKVEIAKLLKLKPNKKLLQQHLTESTEKVVLLKDISNIQTALCNKKDRNNLDALATKLRSIEGENVCHLMYTH